MGMMRVMGPMTSSFQLAHARVRFKFFENPAAVESIRVALAPLERLVPGWCREIEVESYASGDNSPVLQVWISDSRRSFKLRIFSDFLDRSPVEQRVSLIHEFVHALMMPLLEFDRTNFLEPLQKKNAELHDFVKIEYNSRMERMTEEFAYLFDGLIGRKDGCERANVRTCEGESTDEHGQTRTDTDEVVRGVAVRPMDSR